MNCMNLLTIPQLKSVTIIKNLLSASSDLILMPVLGLFSRAKDSVPNVKQHAQMYFIFVDTQLYTLHIKINAMFARSNSIRKMFQNVILM